MEFSPHKETVGLSGVKPGSTGYARRDSMAMDRRRAKPAPRTAIRVSGSRPLRAHGAFVTIDVAALCTRAVPIDANGRIATGLRRSPNAVVVNQAARPARVAYIGDVVFIAIDAKPARDVAHVGLSV